MLKPFLGPPVEGFLCPPRPAPPLGCLAVMAGAEASPVAADEVAGAVPVCWAFASAGPAVAGAFEEPFIELN